MFIPNPPINTNMFAFGCVSSTKKQTPNRAFCFFGNKLGENRSPAKNRSSAAIFRAVVESNGRIAQCEAQAILPSFAMPDSPRLHQKQNRPERVRLLIIQM